MHPLAADATDFFTWESLLTFQGSTLAVVIVSNVAAYMFGQRFDWLCKWLALLLALGIQVVVVLSAGDAGAKEWFIALLNGLLVFSAAMGLNQTGNAIVRRYTRNTQGFAARIFASWL